MYGDNEKVLGDVKVLNEILNRQGSKLLLHVIAEHVGNTNLKFKLSDGEINNVVTSLTGELKESILERV